MEAAPTPRGGDATSRHTLMNKNAEVLALDYDDDQHAVSRVTDVHDLGRAPLAGFAQEARRILSVCPSRYMYEQRLEYLEACIDSCIRVVAELAGRSCVRTSDMGAVQERADEIDRLRLRFLGDLGMPPALEV